MLNKKFIVISAPSGGGKDTIIKKLISKFPKACRLVTTTTREMRSDDVDGKTYNFIDKKKFKQKIKNNELVEHNYYNGQYYGIDKATLKKTLAKCDLVFTNIDVNGKASLDKNNIEHLAIFIEPESIKVLEGRIKERGGTTPEDLKKRLKIAKNEIKMANIYDFRVLNREGHVDETVNEIVNIITKT